MLDILAVGYSVRSLARSALVAGLEVATIDAFGDRDLVEPAPVPAAHRTLSPFDAGALAHHAPSSRRLAWTSNLENAPGVLEVLGTSRQVLGNGGAVVRRARQPELVAQVLESSGLPGARVVGAAVAGGPALLRKPRASGGGHGVSRWPGCEAAGDDTYLQEEVAGVPGSLLFLADGAAVVPVTMTRQLVGDAAFGAHGFTWCGNLAGQDVLPRQDELAASALAAARALARAFGLRGLNGIDFIARHGEAVVIEVNPRWTASAELAERALGTTLFTSHAEASEGRQASLPAWPGGRVTGKAVVYATEARTMGNTDSWLQDDDVRDIPTTGSPVPAGAPICTVLAAASTAGECLALLRRKADRVRAA